MASFGLALVGALALAASCAGPDVLPLRVYAGGDCLLDRGNGRGGLPPSEDRRWDLLRGAVGAEGVFLFNLETAIGQGGTARQKRYLFQAPPEALLPLRRFPHACAALANNHSMDYGPEGVLATLSCLDSAGIAHAGAGPTLEEAWAGVSLDGSHGGVFVLSCGFDNEASSYSDLHGAAIAPVDPDRIGEAIRRHRSVAAAVVVMLHWGTEYATGFTETQRRIARSVVDAGADLVIGSGPHVLQGLELYHGSLICYSLGNLVFDDLGDAETSAALLVRMSVSSSPSGLRRRSFEVAPLRTHGFRAGPECPGRRDALDITRHLAGRSPDAVIFGGLPLLKRNGLYWIRIREHVD